MKQWWHQAFQPVRGNREWCYIRTYFKTYSEPEDRLSTSKRFGGGFFKSPFSKGGFRGNTVHLRGSEELVGSAHPTTLIFVILNGAKRSEESLFFQ
jgi:hypothetical protein